MKAALHDFRNMNKRKVLIFHGLSGLWFPLVGLMGEGTLNSYVNCELKVVRNPCVVRDNDKESD